MCVTFPGQVVSVGPAGATVRTEGRTRQASTLLYPEVRPGEWVLVAVGTIVQRLSDEEAGAIRSTLLEAIDLGGGAQPAGAERDTS
jgi:hydrogenase assembly chaperone HypC/HupF